MQILAIYCPRSLIDSSLVFALSMCALPSMYPERDLKGMLYPMCVLRFEWRVLRDSCIYAISAKPIRWSSRLVSWRSFMQWGTERFKNRQLHRKIELSRHIPQKRLFCIFRWI